MSTAGLVFESKRQREKHVFTVGGSGETSDKLAEEILKTSWQTRTEVKAELKAKTGS